MRIAGFSWRFSRVVSGFPGVKCCTTAQGCARIILRATEGALNVKGRMRYVLRGKLGSLNSPLSDSGGMRYASPRLLDFGIGVAGPSVPWLSAAGSGRHK